ncbi:caspase-3-like [Montipora foliosa]|uniref:caspase-3-like n=1 Tax=Montipora foliosa TaxID=591990 RepID=UPI0035F1B92D
MEIRCPQWNRQFSALFNDSSPARYSGYLDQEDDLEIHSLISPVRNLNFPRSKNISYAPRLHQRPIDEAYNGISNPYVLVINNVNFLSSKDSRPRNGANHDRDNIRAFVKEAGFENVVERSDLSGEEMLELMEKTRQIGELVDHDSFICIIMSHGNERGILGVDCQTVAVEKITAKFQGDQCPQLSTKPKLFFLQACRGEVDDVGYLVHQGQGSHVCADAGEEGEMPVKLPSDADILIAYSTTKGYLSHRRFTVNIKDAERYGKILGSWFISCLMQVLQQYSHKEDLMTMLTRVNNSLSKQYSEPDGCKQISCQLSMLTKKVYFVNFLGKNQQQQAW